MPQMFFIIAISLVSSVSFAQSKKQMPVHVECIRDLKFCDEEQYTKAADAVRAKLETLDGEIKKALVEQAKLCFETTDKFRKDRCAANKEDETGYLDLEIRAQKIKTLIEKKNSRHC